MKPSKLPKPLGCFHIRPGEQPAEPPEEFQQAAWGLLFVLALFSGFPVMCLVGWVLRLSSSSTGRFGLILRSPHVSF